MQPVHISLIQLHEYDSSGQLQDTQENKLNHEQESSEEYYRTEYDIRKSNNKGSCKLSLTHSLTLMKLAAHKKLQINFAVSQKLKSIFTFLYFKSLISSLILVLCASC